MSSSATSTTRKVIESADWNPKSHKYMAPKVNSMGGKSVSLISTQSNRSLHLNTPLLMTWGISDFVGDDGNSDGKFKLSLNFPNPEYTSKDTDSFLQKLTEFQNQVIDDAVTNSELWFSKKKSKELVEDSFFPFLKYPKKKDATGKPTGEIDYSRPPSFSAKVPVYKQEDGSHKWECDIFDVQYNQIFPTDDDDVTPVELVPKLSKIACTIQCTGIWIGGKGWGLTWKFVSGVVKPKQNETVRGKCHITLPPDAFNESSLDESPQDIDEPDSAPVAHEKPSTVVEDSDDEDGPLTKSVSTPPATPQASEPPKIVKKIVKKKVVATA